MYKYLLAAMVFSGFFAMVPAHAATECQQSCVQENSDCLQGCKNENGGMDAECKQMCSKGLSECQTDCKAE